MYAVFIGDLERGLKLFGPFASLGEANDWADKVSEDGFWHTLLINPPTEEMQAPASWENALRKKEEIPQC